MPDLSNQAQLRVTQTAFLLKEQKLLLDFNHLSTL